MSDTASDAPQVDPGGPGGWARGVAALAVAVAVGLHLVVGFFTISTGLLAPLWAILGLAALWLAAAALLVVLARRRPLATPLVPAVNGLLLWAAVLAGQSLLGWTP